MVDFITEPDNTQENEFDKYFIEEIVPRIEYANKVKDKYRSRFWGYLWTVVFLMSTNCLVVLFNALIKNGPCNFEQLILINVIAVLLVFLPVYSYYRAPKEDIFSEFLKFYGNWQHTRNGDIKLVHSPIIPKHDSVGATHSIEGNFADTKVQIRDTYYKKRLLLKNLKWYRTVSKGVIVYVTFPSEFSGKLLLFDKSGFYRKNKFPELINIGSEIEIPAANYFKIYTNNKDSAKSILVSLFFEKMLDLKDVFGAHSVYVEMNGNFMRVYLENSTLYFDNYKLWSKKIDKESFLKLDKKFQQTYDFVQMVKVLIAQ